MAVSKRLRYEILRRDNYTCRYCGASAPEVKLTVDHVTPVALGGKDEAENLVAACQPCNAGKSSSSPDAPLVANVSEDALRWARAKDHAFELWRCENTRLQAALRGFEWWWSRWQCNGEQIPLPQDWADSVTHWMGRGFSEEDLVDMIDIAMKKPNVQPRERWRYLCGVVWRTLDKIEDAAATAIEADVGYSDGFEDGSEVVVNALEPQLARLEAENTAMRSLLAQYDIGWAAIDGHPVEPEWV